MMSAKWTGRPTDDELRRAFDTLDTDHSGQVSEDDVRTLFSRLGLDQRGEDWALVLRAAELGPPGDTTAACRFNGSSVHGQLRTRRVHLK